MFAAGLAVLCSGLGVAYAQFPPTPEGITTVKSKFHENVTISFKEPEICETTPGVKSYSGYVHLPPRFLDNETQAYPINTFFWFFEARKAPENAPLAIWLNGGPGASSMMAVLEENGPCFVGPDSKSTYLNPWSWNNEVNILYLDQPTQVGFSYDTPTNATITMLSNNEGEILIKPADFSDGVPGTNYTYRVGTLSSQNSTFTANSTEQAAHALWHFAQTWFTEFPYYRPADNRLSLWAESYGGHYGPSFLRFFQRQNEKIDNGSSPEKDAHYLHFDTLGIVNGLVDSVVQGESYIQFPYNNTYGIQLFNQSLYERLMTEWNEPNGCKEQLSKCQDSLKERDPISLSLLKKNATEICGQIRDQCVFGTASIYQEMEGAHAWLDIGHPLHDPFPAPHHVGYLKEASVLAALGVPVNHSALSNVVNDGFSNTFDIVHGGYLDAIAYLLDSGVKVHMMYGDRDYACNWVGGEKASLAVPYSRIGEFADAGYSPMITLEGIAGMTRQVGNFSFTRVFDAGHEVPSYQPVTAYEIFMRATFDRDIATGLIPLTDDLVTIGPKDTWHIKNTPPELPTPRCYIAKPHTCTTEVWEKVVSGEAVVKDWFVVEDDEDTAAFDDASGAQDVIGDL